MDLIKKIISFVILGVMYSDYVVAMDLPQQKEIRTEANKENMGAIMKNQKADKVFSCPSKKEMLACKKKLEVM